MKLLFTLCWVAGSLLGQPFVDYPRQIKRPPALDARTYQFTRTNGSGVSGTLTSAGAVSITFTPCPLGVAGADAAHFLYIFGGTGTAESVLITGGTCTSGAASGTVSFTSVNTHSGAWKVSSASGGIREAILVSDGNATIDIPSGTTIVSATANGEAITVDKLNIVLRGTGSGTILQARDSASLNGVIGVPGSTGAGAKFYDFAIDGNRASGGTNPINGYGIDAGANGTGGANNITVRGTTIYNVARFGIIVSDLNENILVDGNYIHDIGGVTDATGGGTGVQVLRAGTNENSTVRVVNNFIERCYNTITIPVGGCIASAGAVANPVRGFFIIQGNYCRNNWNQGGQVSTIGATIISNNIIVTAGAVPGGLTESTSGIETDGDAVVITGNIVTRHPTGGGIVVEGNPDKFNGDSLISGNFVSDALQGIALINAGATVRGMTITGNRVASGLAGTVGLYFGTGISNSIAMANNLNDSDTFVDDNSLGGVALSNNWPPPANLFNGGTVASGTIISGLRCNAVYSVTGAAAIQSLDVLTSWAGVNYEGCIITLVPAAGATWTTTTAGHIGLASTAVVGKALIMTNDGTKFWPSY